MTWSFYIRKIYMGKINCWCKMITSYIPPAYFSQSWESHSPEFWRTEVWSEDCNFGQAPLLLFGFEKIFDTCTHTDIYTNTYFIIYICCIFLYCPYNCSQLFLYDKKWKILDKIGVIAIVVSCVVLLQGNFEYSLELFKKCKNGWN